MAPKILLMLAERSRDRHDRGGPSPIMVDLIRQLGARAEVSVGFSDDHFGDAIGSPADWDLAVWKSRSPAWVPIARRLSEAGIPILDPLESRRVICDKAQCFARLAGAGCAVPETTAGTNRVEVARLLETGSVILKPNPGGRGQGIQVISELGQLPSELNNVVIQRYVPGDGWDLKAYVVGERVWGFRKKFSPESYLHAGESVQLSPEVKTEALGVGRALGASMYGVDFVLGETGYVAVDVNWFPSYRGIDGGVEALVGHILHQAAP